MDLNTMNLRLRTLTVFAGIRKDPVVAALEAVPAADSDEYVERYCAFAAALFKKDTNWSRYLHDLVMADDNICVRRAAAGKETAASLSDSLAQELTILQDLSRITSEDLTVGVDYDGYLPQWETDEYDFAGDYAKHLEELPRKGYGIFARYHSFRVEEGEIAPILCPDPVRLDELVRYEAQREPVIANTKAFLQGLPANNVLLYGDAGTGKSSTVKAIVNEYRDQGLRMIEIKQSQLMEIPAVLEALADNPLRFILFIDDLSFDSGNDEYIALKNILEGGAYDTRGNTLIYATSNRRHFIKEDAASRAGSEMFVNDTIQETMSLAARFGLTVTFQKPAKNLYLEIVDALAGRAGIKMDQDELHTQAEAFAIRASGRSPRTARQFVDTLNIKKHIQEGNIMAKENLATRTANTLRAQIGKGVYAAGDKLPNENELSAKLGISRTTLREAIRILVSEGVLSVQRGSGTYVSGPMGKTAQTSLDMNDMKVTLRDLYEARLIFEPQAAALAARRASDEEIAEILRLGEKVQRLIKKDPAGEARIASETAFHAAIIRASHNEFLANFMPIINETLEKTFALDYNLDVIAEDAYKDHILIMNFLEKRDAEGLRSAVMIHLHHALANEEISLDD